jgi:hypothetical protein
VQNVTTAGCPFPGALGLLGGFLLAIWLRRPDHLRGHLCGRLSGISDRCQGFGPGVLDRFDQFVGGLGRGLDDVLSQLLGILHHSGAGPVGVEGGSVGARVDLVVGVGLEVRGELIGNRVEPIGNG